MRDEDREIQSLFAVLRCLGKGTIRDVERKLGWKPRALDKAARRRKGGLRLRELKKVLAAANIPPGWFFSQVYGGAAPAERFWMEGRLLIRKFWRQLPKVPSNAARTKDRLSDSELRRLDDLRYVDPAGAVREAQTVAREAVREGRFGDASSAFARHASALRVMCRFHFAHASLAWALNWAPPETLGDLWQRASYLAGDYGDYKTAQALASEAIVEAASYGNSRGIGNALIARGRFMYKNGDYDSAIRMFKAALNTFLLTERRGRCAAWQCLGVVYQSMGNLEEASMSTENAAREEMPPGTSGGRLYWLRARIAASQGNWEQATLFYEEAVSRLVPSPGDAALATCEYARLLLRMGRPDLAVGVARSAARYVKPCNNRIISTALRSLILTAAQGSLDLHNVDLTISRVSGALKKLRTATRLPEWT